MSYVAEMPTFAPCAFLQVQISTGDACGHEGLCPSSQGLLPALLSSHQDAVPGTRLHSQKTVWPHTCRPSAPAGLGAGQKSCCSGCHYPLGSCLCDSRSFLEAQVSLTCCSGINAVPKSNYLRSCRGCAARLYQHSIQATSSCFLPHQGAESALGKPGRLANFLFSDAGLHIQFLSACQHIRENDLVWSHAPTPYRY